MFADRSVVRNSVIHIRCFRNKCETAKVFVFPERSTITGGGDPRSATRSMKS